MKKKEEKTEKKSEKKYIIEYLIKFLNILFCICIIYNIMFFIYTTITQKEYFSVFGISLFSMENELMEEEISKNDLIITKDITRYQDNLTINDNIVYERNKQIKINKIIKINQDNGKTEYVTKAIKNYHPENEPVKNGQIIGKVILNIPILGILLNILQSKITTIIIIIFLIFKLLYNKYQYKMRKERKKKKYLGSVPK